MRKSAPDFSLEGKVTLVTGASRGIGHACALACAAAALIVAPALFITVACALAPPSGAVSTIRPIAHSTTWRGGKRSVRGAQNASAKAGSIAMSARVGFRQGPSFQSHKPPASPAAVAFLSAIMTERWER